MLISTVITNGRITTAIKPTIDTERIIALRIKEIYKALDRCCVQTANKKPVNQNTIAKIKSYIAALLCSLETFGVSMNHLLLISKEKLWRL